MPPKDKDKDKKEKKEKKKKGMITIKDNGAVKFLEDGETPFDEIQSSDCNCTGQEFCQIVHSADATPFQVGLSEATGSDLASNGSFSSDSVWSKGSGWTITGGKAVHTASGGGALSESISGLRGSTYYKIVFTVASYSNSQTLSVLFAGDTIKTLNANGTYTVYWFTDATLGGTTLSFTPHASTSLNLDNVAVYEMSTVIYGIKDLNDQVIKTITDGTGVTYYQGSASIEVDWSDVEAGCYRLFLVDNSTNHFTDAIDGTFETASPSDVNPTSWNLTRGSGVTLTRSSISEHDGTYGCEVAIAGVPAQAHIFSADTAITVEANKDYVVSGWVYFPETIIEIFTTTHFAYLRPTTYSLAQCDTVIGATCNSVLGGPGRTRKLVYQDGVFESSTNVGLPGVWVELTTYFNTGANTSINFGLYFNGVLSEFKDTFTFYIDTLSMRGPVDIESECFKLGSFECTKLLSWTNNEDAYGFTYDGNTFQHELRVKSKLWKPKYPKDKKEVFVDSAGNRRILTSRTKKEEELSVEEIPTYLHDALSIGVEHDNFYIDGVKYINEETDYDPAWRNSSLLAPVVVTVTKDSQDLSNSYC